MTSSVTGVDRGVLQRSEDAVLQSAVDAEMPVAGVVAMVTDRTGNVYEGAAGTRRFGGKDAITTDDAFALFSTTKAITATAALQLVEEGQLDLDRPEVGVVGPALGAADELHLGAGGGRGRRGVGPLGRVGAGRHAVDVVERAHQRQCAGIDGIDIALRIHRQSGRLRRGCGSEDSLHNQVLIT